jgi:hypothetical protein
MLNILTTKEMHIKTTLTLHLILVRMATIKTQTSWEPVAQAGAHGSHL